MSGFVRWELYVSILEPVMLAKEYMRQHSRYTRDDFQKNSNLLLNMLDYNTQAFTSMICQSIFNTPNDVSSPDKDLSEAEKILVWDGMKHEYVTECTRRVFELIFDSLSSSIPEFLYMDEQNVEFQVLSEVDLRLTLLVDESTKYGPSSTVNHPKGN